MSQQVTRLTTSDYSVAIITTDTYYGSYRYQALQDGNKYCVYNSSSNGYAYFGFTAFSVPAGVTINSISVDSWSMDAGGAGGGGWGKNAIKVNGSDYAGAQVDYGTWAESVSTWTTNPDTGAAWTVADVNGTGSHPLQYLGFYGHGYSSYDSGNKTWVYWYEQLCYLAITVTYTLNAPTVTTSAASSIGQTSATGTGNVTSDGGSGITERGVCWSTSANPTTSSSKQTAAGTTGSYTATMGSLTAGTHYHYRAYAINSTGTSYGADTEFDTTSAASPINTGSSGDFAGPFNVGS